jgi:hypothetical protein
VLSQLSYIPGARFEHDRDALIDARSMRLPPHADRSAGGYQTLYGLKSEKDKAFIEPLGFVSRRLHSCGYRPRESSGFPPRAEPPPDTGEPVPLRAAFGNLVFGAHPGSGRGKPHPCGMGPYSSAPSCGRYCEL